MSSYFPIPNSLLIPMISKSHNCAVNELEKHKKKKMITYHFKDFIKQPVIKQSPTFLSFSFLIDCCMRNFEKLMRFYQ